MADGRRDQQDNETDALLSNAHQPQYGGLEDEDPELPDEEEIRRGREALERITNEATDNMIDVSHPSSADLSQHLAAHTNHDRHTAQEHEINGPSKQIEPAADDEEALWLQNVQSPGQTSEIKGLQSGTLVLDIGELRKEQPASSTQRLPQRAAN